MCGVIGCVFEKDTSTLGQTATRLLRMLEYRGYDSTGGIVQDSDGRITLRKDVGAPSDVAVRLGIDRLSGHIFCGQVRWATFGVVSRDNAQPHEMTCKLHFYGAHNGNITNCERLKEWLKREGHAVKSDNDGEMLVHTIEHYFAEELRYKDADDREVRHEALRQAVLRASTQVVGSYASVVVDPTSGLMAVIKAGSSLYLGRGVHPDGGAFHLASSDLASVLQLTRVLIPIREKEFAIFDHQQFTLYDLRNGRKIKRPSQRSLLKVEETRLDPAFTYFMEQEIHHQVPSARRLIERFDGGDALVARVRQKKVDRDLLAKCRTEVARLAEVTETEELRAGWRKWLESAPARSLEHLAGEVEGLTQGRRLESTHGAFLEELREISDCARFPTLSPMLACLDAAFDLSEVEDLEKRLRRFIQIMKQARERNGTIYILACGSSFHAGKTAPLFFNEIAGVPVIPLLPGEFRAQCTQSLRAEDVLIGISQSGETKDLIDVFNFVTENYPGVKKICVLNNTNSTLAQEKSDLYISLYCGPEISVPATKSFMNQLLVLFMLAVRLREELQPKGRRGARKTRAGEADFWAMVERVPDLIDRTIKTTKKEIEEIANELFIRPSIHILATRLLGIAKEG
ncbi:MAG TPA: SIS domain-containing protein, partial [Candidatus Ozemobacteraceae bacterium]|nr:SIS domain-containing protein [Candidatus Ozemobacteraceae bacterium]